MASGTNIGTAYVQIVPQTKGISGSVSKAMEGESIAAGTSAGLNIASKIKAVIAAAGIGEALKKTIMEGAALEQSLGGIETLYGKHADKVIANANKAWQTAGVSANDYMEQSTAFAASLLKSLGGDTEAAAKYADMAIIDMSDNANKFGMDINRLQMAYAGFSRQNYTMLDNLSLGFAGTKQGMQDLLAAAEEITGKQYSIDSLADVYEAIHVIQEDLGVTGTTAEEAATTLSGSFNSMKAAAANFMGNLAVRPELVQQSLSDLVQTTSTFLFNNLVPALGNVMQSIPTVIASFMKGDFVGKLFTSMGDFSSKLLSGASSFVDAGLGLIMKLAEGIAKGLPTVIEQFPVILGNIADIINVNAPKLFTAALYIIKTLAIGIIKAVPTLLANIPQILVALGKAFMAFSWANLGRSVLIGMRSSLVGPVQKGISGVIQTVKGKAGAIVNAFKAPFITARNAVTAIVARIKGLFNFKFSTPKIKVPKFNITPAGWKVGDLLKGKIPKLSVKWNKEGGIFDSAQIVGYGVGEAGAEAIIPLDRFWQQMSRIEENAKGGGTMNVVITLDGKTIGQSTVDYINGQTLMFGASPVMV